MQSLGKLQGVLQRLNDVSDSTELQICDNIWLTGWTFSYEEGKGAFYFNGDMTDGKAKVCLYGFDDNMRKRQLDVSGSAIALANCQVNLRHTGSRYCIS